MYGFYIYKKVAARDSGRIQVFSHLAIRRIREIFVQRQFASPQARSFFAHQPMPF
jgi:hypothetical protein